MEFLAAGFSSLLSVFVLALFVAGIMKLFQIHTVLTEIKDSLRTNAVARPVTPYSASSVSAPAAPEALHSMGSGEDMLRALDAQIKLDALTSSENRER